MLLFKKKGKERKDHPDPHQNPNPKSNSLQMQVEQTRILMGQQSQMHNQYSNPTRGNEGSISQTQQIPSDHEVSQSISKSLDFMPEQHDYPHTLEQHQTQQYETIVAQQYQQVQINNNEENILEQQEISNSQMVSQNPDQHELDIVRCFDKPQKMDDMKVDQSQQLVDHAQMEQQSNISESLEDQNYNKQFKSSYFKITEIKPTPATHKVVIVIDTTHAYPIVQFAEEYEDEDKDLQCTNDPGLLVCQMKQELPCYEYEERLCQKHHLNIEHVCLEEHCKMKNQFLLCSKCIKIHKSHNFIELQEVLHTVKKRQRQFDEQDQLFEEMQRQSQMQLKVIKSKIMSEILGIETQLHEGFELLKGQLLAQRELYQTIIINLIEGGIMKLTEAVSIYSDEFTYSESSINKNNFLKEFIEKLEVVNQKINNFAGVGVAPSLKQYQTIQVDNIELEIETTNIQNLDALDQQIKMQLLKKDQYNMIQKDFLLMKDCEAIRLQGNIQPSDLDLRTPCKIISYYSL